MYFASPLWLFALLPWLAGVLWLLWGRRRKTPVPFLELWRGPALLKPAKRALQPPPIFLAMAILATLLALLAAGRPRVVSPRWSPGNPVTIIVDRGISMSASAGSDRRFDVAARMADKAIKSATSDTTRIDLIVLPAGAPKSTTVSEWLSNVARLSPTADDTQAILEQIAREKLANTRESVVVISDRKLSFEDSRLIQFAPDSPIDNVGIIEFTARETPAPAVMVRIRNDSNRKAVDLAVSSGTAKVERTIALPPSGGEQNYFVELPKFDAVIEAALNVKDDQPADDRAWLVREGTYPTIEPRTPLSPQLRRIIDVYTHSRPPGDGSQKVAVVGSETDFPANIAAVCVASTISTNASGVVVAASHPVVANVNWQAFPSQVEITGESPRGWTPLVTMGQRVIVACQSGSLRRVWVGFESPAWSATPDFVVFWANVFTWLGEGQERFAGHPLSSYSSDWKPVESTGNESGSWPGVFRADDGTLRAFNAPSMAVSAARTTPDWRQRLSEAQSNYPGEYDLSPESLIAGLVCLTLGVGMWKRVPTRREA